MSATFKRAAAFLIALCLSVGLFGQLVLADDIVETEEPAAEEILEIEAESEDEDIIAVPEEAAIPESEDEEPSAEAAIESASSEEVEETTEPESEKEESLVLFETGWVERDDGWYYYDENGDPVQGWQTIDGSTYYFDGNGWMYADTTLWSWNEESGKDEVYRFDGEGHIVTGWYDCGEDYWYRYYYYHEDGKAANGLTIVDGKQYYFGYDGSMYHDETVKDNDSGKLIVIDSDGIVIDAVTIEEGWNDVGSDRYYYENGIAVTGWKEIGGNKYYFDWNGRMYADTTLWSWNEETGKDEVYRFDGEGHIVTGWYDAGEEYWGRWYYYYEDGKAANGLTELNGEKYYFSSDGMMYYDTTVSIWDETEGKNFNYRLDEDGHIVTGWYINGDPEWGTRYYYYDDGKAATGLTTVDGNQYYFYSYGEMCRDTTAYDAESNKLIAVGADGIVTETADMGNGWGHIGDDWYYSKNGELVRNRWEKIGDYWYYFGWDGIMYSHGMQWLEDGCYCFDEDGHMITGWYQDYDGWHYFLSSGKAASGLTTVNGKKYYFLDRGRMAVAGKYIDGTTLYVVDGEGIASVYSGANGWVNNTYYIKNGKVVTGWCEIGGYWYYFGTNGVYRNEISYIDGKYYSFDSSGAMRKGWFKSGLSWLYGDSSGALKYNEWMKSGNTWYYFNNYYAETDIAVIDGKIELFNTSGAWKETVKETNKWVKNDKYWYFIKSNGQFAQYELVDDYFCDDYGRMITNEYRWTNGGYFYFGSDGKKLVSTWVENSGDWQYYDESGKRVESSWKKIGSTWYYFNNLGNMVVGDQVIDNRVYQFNNSGACVNSSGVALKNGWNLAYGKYYYYENGDIVRSCLKEINGATYYFNYDGTMAFDGTYRLDGGNGYKYYYFTKSGKMLKNGWAQNIYGYWFYAESDGTLADGLKTIGGKQYFFDDGMMEEYDVVADNTYYVIGYDGVVKEAIKANFSGWKHLSDGRWIYCKDNAFPKGILKVGGAYYYFNSGLMLTNFMSYGNGYFGSDGKLVKNDGWVKNYAGEWYYLVNGSPVYGSRYIDGKWYYFGRNNVVSDGVYFVDGALYKYAGASGGRTKLNWNDGWHQSGSNWYYIKNGSVVSWELMKIGSKYYFFDSDGKMLTGDAVIRTGSGSFKFLRSDGTFLKNGWKKLNGEWYYFGADGNVLTGEWTIDGVKYNLHVPTSYYGYMYGIG